MDKWIITSIVSIVPQDEYLSKTTFIARNEISGLEKEFYTVMGTYEVGDAFYPTNVD
jgi:hypothetical protein